MHPVSLLLYQHPSAERKRGELVPTCTQCVEGWGLGKLGLPLQTRQKALYNHSQTLNHTRTAYIHTHMHETVSYHKEVLVNLS